MRHISRTSCNTNCFNSSFLPHTIVNWNDLPSHIATLEDPNMFHYAVCSLPLPLTYHAFSLSAFMLSTCWLQQPIFHEHVFYSNLLQLPTYGWCLLVYSIWQWSYQMFFFVCFPTPYVYIHATCCHYMCTVFIYLPLYTALWWGPSKEHE